MNPNDRNCTCLVVVIGICIILGLLIHQMTNPLPINLPKKPINNNDYIKLDVEGINIREWVDIVFLIDGLEYTVPRRFITNSISNIFNDDGYLNDNLMFRYVWRNNKSVYVPNIIDINSKIDTNIKFIYSDFYPESKIKSYKTYIVTDKN